MLMKPDFVYSKICFL